MNHGFTCADSRAEAGSRGGEPKLGSPGASARWWNFGHRGFAPSRALMRVMVDLIESVPQERVSERIVEQTVDNAKHQNDSPQEHISVDAPVPQDVASAPCRRQEAADGK